MADKNEAELRNGDLGKSGGENSTVPKINDSVLPSGSDSPDPTPADINPNAPIGEDGQPLYFEAYDHRAAQDELPEGISTSERFGEFASRFDPEELRVQPQEFSVCVSHRFERFGRL